MYAVIKTGGKQYRVQPGDTIVVEKLEGDAGAELTLGSVLMLGGDNGVTLGAPLIEGATVAATLIETRKGEKIKIFKKTRRQGYRRTNGHRQMESVLRRVTDEAAGKWLLVHVDIDAQPRLAQSLKVQAVPMLVAVIGGQLAPLAQGTIDEQQFRQITEQVIQAAISAGMVGRAEPVRVEVSSEESVGPDPRTVEAEKLMEAGKFDEAVAAYDALLASEPNDPVLIAGRNGAALLGRLDGKDSAALLTAAQQHPDDVDAQLAAADVELMGGRSTDAFNRIIQVVRTTRDEERETARSRLLDLFAMVGQSTPEVAAARRSLAAALF